MTTIAGLQSCVVLNMLPRTAARPFGGDRCTTRSPIALCVQRVVVVIVRRVVPAVVATFGDTAGPRIKATLIP